MRKIARALVTMKVGLISFLLNGFSHGTAAFTVPHFSIKRFWPCKNVNFRLLSKGYCPSAFNTEYPGAAF
jgi:hypothetical protein